MISELGNFAPRERVMDAYFGELADRATTLICNIGLDCGVKAKDFTVSVVRRDDDTGFKLTVTPHIALDHTMASLFAQLSEAIKRKAPGAAVAKDGDNLVFTCGHITDFKSVLSVLEKPYGNLVMSQSA